MKSGTETASTTVNGCLQYGQQLARMDMQRSWCWLMVKPEFLWWKWMLDDSVEIFAKNWLWSPKIEHFDLKLIRNRRGKLVEGISSYSSHWRRKTFFWKSLSSKFHFESQKFCVNLCKIVKGMNTHELFVI